MTTPARQLEADRVELVYHWALVQIGVGTIEDALALWEEVPATQQAATAARWLSEAVEMVSTYRAFTKVLALAYYRLVRALRTGATIALPDRDEPEYVSLEMLRDEFEALVDEVAQAVPEQAQEPAQDAPAEDAEGDPLPDDEQEPYEEPEYEDDDYDEDDQILLEEIAELEELSERLDREADEQAALLLDQLGIENMLKKLEEIAEDEAAAEADRQREEAHRQAGTRQAAVAERITLNAARGLVYNLSEYDGRVQGWARFSQTGTPCGWCAMLISRGAVYKSARSASVAENDDGNRTDPGDHNKYHDNCHCVAIPVFTDGQYESSDLFALNREYDRLWQNGDKANGLPAHPSLEEWRAYWRRIHKQQRTQAVRSTDTTQEVA